MDETLIPFKGRWKARLRVRGKPHATGCKLFTLADSDGFVYDFWLYCGKGSAHNRSNNTVGYVYDLLENLPDRDTRKYCVIADQFYGSEDLALKLYDAGYDMIPCCQKNRPTYLFANVMQLKVNDTDDKRQYIMKKKTRNLYACTFKDTGKCNCFTTVGINNIVRQQRKRNRSDYLIFYNNNMNGVDRQEAAVSLYLTKHRNKRYTFTAFHYVMKMLMTCTWKLYRTVHRRSEQKDFVLACLKDLGISLIGHKV